MAGGQSSASLSNLRFSLIDLDPEDGLTSDYSFGSVSPQGPLSLASVRVGDRGFNDGELVSDRMASPFAFDAVVASATLGGAYAQAAIDGNSLTASGAYGAAGTFAKYEADAATGGTSTLNAPGGLWTLTLSPRSVLLVSVDASASAWAGNLSCETGTESNNFGADCGPEIAVGLASMGLSYRYESNATTVYYNYWDSVRAQARAESLYGGFRIGPDGVYRQLLSVGPDQSETSARTLTAVFANTSDQWQQGTLSLSTTVFGYGTSPIPEPSSAGMFALGLWMLHRVRRRTQRPG